MNVAPRPRMRPAWRRNAAASCGSKLPMVEPGKKPTRGIIRTASGSSNGLVKSAATGSTWSFGYSRAQRRHLLVQELAEMSTGT